MSSEFCCLKFQAWCEGKVGKKRTGILHHTQMVKMATGEFFDKWAVDLGYGHTMPIDCCPFCGKKLELIKGDKKQ